ncbi:tetratricopeptide repeat protein [Pseudonocardia acaciae]|uniref:tetratricopeptide repeat protein n=1 Tax=Pseudonocardia acaciae TaxID=551276 RepID=UPI003CCC309F
MVGRDPAHEPALAAALNSLANRYATAGWRDEGLAVARKTVELYRRLAANNPDAHLHSLATTAHNLVTDLRKAGRPGEAHALAREAERYYLELGVTAPASLGPKTDGPGG